MDKEYIINQITAMLYANGEPVPLTKWNRYWRPIKKR